MGRFSLQRLFIAITLIVLGTARIVVRPHGKFDVLFWFLGGAMVGAGALSLWKRPIVGALVGAVAGMIIQLVIAGMLINDVP